MRTIASLLIVCLSLGACTAETYVSPTGFAAMEFHVASDPQAHYVMLDVTPHADGRVVTLSKRKGSSGVSYTRRFIDCHTWTFVTLGSGATLADMRRSAPDRVMASIVPAAITDINATVGCGHVGISRTE